MEKSEQSTNNQRANELRAFRDLVVAAIFFLTIITAIVLSSRALEQNIKNLVEWLVNLSALRTGKKYEQSYSNGM